MLKKRLIACLLVRDGLIVQSIGFNKYLPIGHPKFPIEFVVKWDVDEIVLLDMSATPQNRGPDLKLIELLSHYCFLPLTVGGGIRSVDDVRNIIRAGGDKASLNTTAFKRPEIISEIADVFGSQCVVISIDAKKMNNGDYNVFLNSGQIDTGVTVQAWAQKVEKLGAGEIFLNSIDRDGKKLGYDENLIRLVSESVQIPVISCGGVGQFTDFSKGIQAGASAVAASNIFHFVEHSTIIAKAQLLKAGVDIRLDSRARYNDREFDSEGRLVMHSMEKLIELEMGATK
jgi:imidazole glycerol-phosphate synthase subunit HisF